MVVVAELWMGHTLKTAIDLAHQRNLQVPRIPTVYMDDSFGVLKQNENQTAHLDFQQCLNDVHPRLKFTFELEENGRLTLML